MSPVMGARLLEWLPTGGLRLAVALLTTVIAGGTVGYVLIEGWSAWDAFYMTVTTITTVGYREVHELNRTGQVFTSFAHWRRGTALYTFTLLATTVVEGGFPSNCDSAGTRRMLESIKIISSSAATAGSAHHRREFARNVPFVIIERGPRACRHRSSTAFSRWRPTSARTSQESRPNGHVD